MKFFAGMGCLTASLVTLVPFAGWLTHVIHCLQTGEWGFLIAGAIVAPIGVIHGWGLWFGFFA